MNVKTDEIKNQIINQSGRKIIEVNSFLRDSKFDSAEFVLGRPLTATEIMNKSITGASYGYKGPEANKLVPFDAQLAEDNLKANQLIFAANLTNDNAQYNQEAEEIRKKINSTYWLELQKYPYYQHISPIDVSAGVSDADLHASYKDTVSKLNIENKYFDEYEKLLKEAKLYKIYVAEDMASFLSEPPGPARDNIIQSVKDEIDEHKKLVGYFELELSHFSEPNISLEPNITLAVFKGLTKNAKEKELKDMDDQIQARQDEREKALAWLKGFVKMYDDDNEINFNLASIVTARKKIRLLDPFSKYVKNTGHLTNAEIAEIYRTYLSGQVYKTGKGLSTTVKAPRKTTAGNWQTLPGGEVAIDLIQLEKRVLSVRHVKSKHKVLGMPNKEISAKFKSIILSLLSGSTPTLGKLSDEYKLILTKLIHHSKTNAKVGGKLPVIERKKPEKKSETLDKLSNSFKVMVGEITAGNDSTVLQNQLMLLLKTMIQKKLITKKQSMDVIKAYITK
jgi:hypothetical protein